MDLVKCNTYPITDPAVLAAIQTLRRTNSFLLVPRADAIPPPSSLPDPTLVFQVTFGRELDQRVKERVQRLFAREWRAVERDEHIDSPGYIYCFHDLADPPNVLKIGRTARQPEERISEWEQTLAPGGGKSVILLFAYRTSCNEFAEAVVHEVLRCARIHNRINPVTRDELREYFQIDNALAASVFVRETLRYVNRFCEQAYAHFGHRARAPQRGGPRRRRFN